MTISWTTPVENGSAVTSYTILIRHSDGTSFSEETTSCDGTQSSIVTANSCTVPLSNLSVAPFSLVLGDTIGAKIIAINVKGSSPESDVGEGAYLISEPDAPVNI